MGFTRYWRRPKELDAKKFVEFSAACKKSCNELQIPLLNAAFDDAVVRFEGEHGCEPFVVKRISSGMERDGYVAEFCKTQSLPYDKAVESCLFILKGYFDEVDVPKAI